MESDEKYIPKSARAPDFKITLSKAAMENTERIEFLQNMVDQAKTTYEGTLKGVVQECITLEIDALIKQEKETIADLLYNLATATMTMSGTTCDPHLRVNNLIETAPFLFQYAPKTSPSSIRGQYAATTQLMDSHSQQSSQSTENMAPRQKSLTPKMQQPLLPNYRKILA